jgi:hypothetical protein
MVQGPWLLAPGSRSPGLGKVVQETRGRFHVPEWGVFCHTERLRNRPARLKLALSDSTILGHGANTVAANYCSGYALGVMREHMEKAW